MSLTLKIENYANANITERTHLTAPVTPGLTELTVANTNRIAANDSLLIGTPGSETGEIRSVADVTAPNSVTTDAASFNHPEDEAVAVLFGTNIRIYRALSSNGDTPADDAFTLLATITIDPDQLATTYVDPAGSNHYWYKRTYYNPTSQAETDLADSIAMRGHNDSDVYATVESIRDAAGFANNPNISDPYIDGFRVTAQAEVDNWLAGRYTTPFTAPINPMIANITKMMAAGLLLLDQYGDYTTSDTKNGQSKIDWAEKRLASLKDGQLVLTNQAGNETPAPSGMGFNGWPNNKTVDDSGGNDFLFHIGDIDGYNGRRY